MPGSSDYSRTEAVALPAMSVSAATQAGVGTATLAGSVEEVGEDDPYVIHGVAIGVDDVTVGQSGTKKYWPAETLEQAAETLEGQPLVRDHINSTKGRIGTVTEAMFMPGKGVLYEAEIKPHYEELAKDVASGMMDVSPRIKHLPEAELSERDGDGALVVEPPAVFDNLSVVNEGASPSNTAVFGDSPHFADREPATMAAGDEGEWATATLSQGTSRTLHNIDQQFETVSELAEMNLDEIYAEWNDHVNMTASELKRWAKNPCAQEASVNTKAVISRNLHLLETPKDEWGESEMKDAKRTISFISRMSDSANKPESPKDGVHGCPSDWAISLLNWAYNPFDSLPDHPEEGELADEEGYDESELAVNYSETPDAQSGEREYMDAEHEELYDTKEAAEERAEELGCSGAHRHTVGGEKKWMPCDSMESFRETMENEENSCGSETAGDTAELSDPAFSEGDWVEWDTRNSTEIGTVEGVYHAGDDLPDFRGDRNYDPEEGEHLYALRIYKEVDGTWHPATGKPIGHYEDSIRDTDTPDSVSDEAMALDEMADVDAIERLPGEEKLGESNTEDHVVGKNDWVQWYPDTGPEESHGKVARVDEKEDQSKETEVVVRKYQQDDDGVWHPTDHTVKLGMSEVEGWGNYPTEDAISDTRLARNPAEGALDEYDIASMPSQARKTEGDGGGDDQGEFDESTKEALQNKVEEHNKEYGDEEGKKVTYSMLRKVYEKGLAAYGDSHRQGMTANQWAMARVNAFLYLVRNGHPENDNYTQDNELLPEGHPKHESDSSENADGSGPDAVAELVDYEMHVPTYDGTHTNEWSRPDLADFVDEMGAEADTFDELTQEQQQSIAEHFIIAEGGFPGENYGDLKLPVVEPDGRLSESALITVKGGHGAQAVEGLSSEMEDKIMSMVDDLLESEFGASEDGEMAQLPHARVGTVAMSTAELSQHGDDEDESFSTGDMVKFTVQGDQMMGKITEIDGEGMESVATIKLMEETDDGMEPTGKEETMPVGTLEKVDVEESAAGGQGPVADAAGDVAVASLDSSDDPDMNIDYFDNTDTDELSDPVVVERDDLEALADEADTAEELSAELDDLNDRLDDMSDAEVVAEELSDEARELITGDTEHRVVEAELAEMVEDVQELYAEELAESMDGFEAEELADRFGPLELRDKLNDHDEASLADEIEETEPEPEAGADEAEELAEGDEDEVDDEALREAYAEELESTLGWDTQAEKVRDGEIDLDDLPVDVDA